MNKFFQKTKKGFTLVELLIVIIIIAVLAGIVLIALNPAEQRARAAATGLKTNVGAVCRAQAVCLVESTTGGAGCDTYAEIKMPTPTPDPDGAGPATANPDITISTASPYTITGVYTGSTTFTFSCQNTLSTGANFGRTDCLAAGGTYTCAGFNLN